MSTIPQLFEQAADLFGERVRAVQDDQWGVATPCDEWDVRTLVNHVVGEQRWAPHLLDGETIDQVGDRYDGDLLGDDPKAVWAEAVGPSVAAFTAPGALDGTVHLSYGDERADEYALQMLTDLAVHGWDLARGIGADDRIDEETAQLLYDTWTARRELLVASGMFAAPVDVPDDAPVAHRLLGLLGRTP
jgi:uncharacterized protein (TIGR03086 family)